MNIYISIVSVRAMKLGLTNELNASRTCISFNEFYQPAFTMYISTPCTWPVSYTTHSVCVVSMLDPVMFGCATLVSAPVKEGPRNVSFVHLQPPAHRESIGILLVYLSVAYYSCKRNQNEEQCDFRSSTICLCVYLRANNPDFLHR